MPPHVPRQAVNVFFELPAQPRLAHPRRAGHHHQPRHPALRRSMEELFDRAELGVPADQRRLQPIHPLRATHVGQHPHRPPQMQPLRLPLQHMLVGIGEPHPAARQPLRRPIHQHRPRFSRRLHPRRGIHRIPRHHPLLGGAQRHRHLARDHPRPRRQPRHARVGPQLSYGGHQVQGSAHRALGIPLRRHRGAPDRHHRVADELLHHPAIAADHRPCHVEIGRQQLPDRLRIPRLRQRGKPHHIAKQHRAHPPLRHRRLAQPSRSPSRRSRRGYRCRRRQIRQLVPAGTAKPVAR